MRRQQRGHCCPEGPPCTHLYVVLHEIEDGGAGPAFLGRTQVLRDQALSPGSLHHDPGERGRVGAGEES